MRGSTYIGDDGRYIAYYANQAGSALPGYAGAPAQYGAGLGGMLRNLFRFAMPLLRRGVSIAKPHIKTAAKHIAGDVVTQLVARATAPRQEGSGFIVNTRRAAKRPPRGVKGCDLASRKRRKSYKSATKVRKGAKDKRRRTEQTKFSNRDIF